jgi:hypothetical protein
MSSLVFTFHDDLEVAGFRLEHVLDLNRHDVWRIACWKVDRVRYVLAFAVRSRLLFPIAFANFLVCLVDDDIPIQTSKLNYNFSENCTTQGTKNASQLPLEILRRVSTDPSLVIVHHLHIFL